MTNVLGEVAWFSKFEIAERQLDRAINLYLDEKDFIAAITLAGAAEEIFGNILNKDGAKSTLDEYIESCTALDDNLKRYGKWFRSDRNFHRNNLKHLAVPHVKNSPYADDPPPDQIPIYASAASDLIYRALINYSKLNQQTLHYAEGFNSNINRFYASEQ